MNNELELEIRTAIKKLSNTINNNVKSDEALKFSQSALNLAHVLEKLSAIKNQKEN